MAKTIVATEMNSRMLANLIKRLYIQKRKAVQY